MITWFVQEHRTSCVAACIRMVLTGFGQQLPERRIRKMLGASSVGHTLEQACQRMREQGVVAMLYADLGVADLRDCLRGGWYPVVGVDRQFFGYNVSSHAVVVIGIGSKTVKFLDPLGSSTPEIASLATFEQAWINTAQQALVIQSPLPG
jgi:ABC-type bacteriocin/lantibiotic exporter with double-glycine peptidase domain